MSHFIRIRSPYAAIASVVLLVTSVAHAKPEPQQKPGDAAFAQQLEALANKCDELGMAEQAEVTRQWLVRRDPERQYLFLIPTTDPTKPDADAARKVLQWHAKFLQLRREHANRLFDQAKTAAGNKQPTRAYQLLHEVLHEDPTHAEARRILSLPEPRAQPKLRAKAGRRRHKQFGWAPNRYWYVDSPHFRITTNDSPQSAVDLANKLEDLYTVWRQLFFRYWSTGTALSERFAGRAALLGGRARKHKVILFRGRDEYVGKLKPSEPNIEITLGYYSKNAQTSFFYAGDPSIESTWFHEATHQLFQEADGSRPTVGDVANFWIAEGIAVYIESLIRHDGYYTVGGFDADRLQYARRYTRLARKHTPLAEIVRFGRDDFQRHPEIKRLYTQSAGIAHLLMDGKGGKYRERCVDYLTIIYRGRDRPDTFATVVGVDPAELDAAYPDFLQVTDEHLAHIGPADSIRSLALPFTAVTDDGLAHLTNHQHLDWVDVCFTDITDKGVMSLRESKRLTVLNLEATEITDACMQVVGTFQQLEQLDLSQTAITDEGLKHVANFKQLNELWLTGTQITDEGLASLEELTELRVLDVSETNVSDAALARLQQRLPKLNRE